MRKHLLTASVFMLSIALFMSAGVQAYAAGPAHGSKMLRMYAPYYLDYTELTRAITPLTTDSSVDPITVQAHFYVESFECTGIDEVFDVFQMWGEASTGYTDPEFTYGVSLHVSSSTYDDKEIKVYVATPYRPWQPVLDYVFEAQEDTWYNVTMFHNDTTVDVYVNDVLNTTINAVPNFSITQNYIRIGETNNMHRQLIFAYNIYVDYIKFESNVNWEEDWEGSDPLSWYMQAKSPDGVIEIVTETETGYIGPGPEVAFTITPGEDTGAQGSTLTFDCNVYNDATESYFELEIIHRTGELWTWTFSETKFILPAEGSKTVKLYCVVGTGNYSYILVHLKRTGSATYWADDAVARSSGADPSQVVGGWGPMPVITGQLEFIMGIFVSIGVGGVGLGMTHGKSPLAGLFMFCVGVLGCTILGWFPIWFPAVLMIILALMVALKLSGAMN